MMPDVDTTRANVARVYDAAAGGKDNYDVDRKLHQEIIGVSPGAVTGALPFRNWLMRAVRFLASIAEIDQFLDLGCGLPAGENVHQLAQRLNPEAQVVYVDNDPIVVAHGRALLEENDRTHVIAGDIRRPQEILRHPVVTKYLDLDRPLALIQSASLQHLADDENPQQLMATYIDALASGSYVAISHVHNPCDGSSLSEVARSIEEMYSRSSSGVTRFRSRAEIAAFFTGLELIEPGLVPIDSWWPDGPKLTPSTDHENLALVAVGRKP